MKTKTYMLICGLLLAPVANGFSTEYVGSEEWQLRRLFEPTQGELKQESKGRVVIYDGLEAEQVERAMKQEFDRIGSMMFIHIKKRKPTGELVTYDDSGC
jgi:hypothetical protein